METQTFFQFLLAFASSVFGSLLLTGVKHILAGTFIWREFWRDSLSPLLWSFLGGVVIALIIWFVPNWSFFVESVVGGEVSLNYERLMATGAILAQLIKQLLKVRETREKHLI